MTREEKLYSMRMIDLSEVAEKLGVKINKKAAKSKAIEAILAAEEMNKQEDAPKITENNAPSDAHIKPISEPEAPGPNKTTKAPRRTNLGLTELTYKGETKSIKDWAAAIGIPVPTLYDRVNRNGWSIKEAIEIPLGQRRPR